MNAYAQTLLDAAYAAYRRRHYAEAWRTLMFVAGSGWRDAVALRFIAHLEDLRNDTEAAVAWLATAISIDPFSATAHSHLADALARLGRLQDAIPKYQRAIELDINLLEAYGGLVGVLHLLHRDAEALALAETAVLHAADKAHAHRMVGTALAWLNRYEAAIEKFRAAQAHSPDDATARHNEGMALLALGQFRAGWPLYEARREPTAIDSTFRDLPQPTWHGDDDIRGRTILLYAEQGLGDAIQFVRYAPLVAARGGIVWLEVARAVKPLLASMRGIAGVTAKGETRPDCALQCPLMSLPHVFDTELASIPAEVPYLPIDPARRDAWRQRLGAPTRRRIGIAWSGNPSHSDDRLRSIPLEMLTPLLQRKDCEFHVVQTGVTAADATRLAQLGVRDDSAALCDFAETAALMASLDLIISVDSAPAHLAGALARPTWVLLQFSADWRWMLDRTDSPWYPTQRLFRQPSPGGWNSVVMDVVQALDTLEQLFLCASVPRW